MPDWRQRAGEYTRNSFPYLKGLELAGALVGVVVLAIFEGVADLIKTVWTELLIVPLRALASFLETLVLTPFLGTRAPGSESWAFGAVQLIELVWRDVEAWLEGMGPSALGLAVIIVLLTGYVMSQGVSRFG